VSDFNKNYYSPKNPAIFLSVSWETGYRNVQVRYNGRLIHTIPHPPVLVDGVKISDQELGTIKIRFSSGRPKKLEIKVNNKKFKTVNKFYTYDYSGLTAIFSGLALFAGIETSILGLFYRFNFLYFDFTLFFIGGILITALYALTVILLMKKINWIYFFGTAIFTLTTILSVFNISLFLASWANYTVLIFRLGILIYLLTQAKHILKEMRKAQGKEENEILDSEQVELHQ
jgi:hypothetical protein